MDKQTDRQTDRWTDGLYSRYMVSVLKPFYIAIATMIHPIKSSTIPFTYQ